MAIETDRLISSEPASVQEEAFERALRPKALAEYVGQEKIRGQLSIFIEAARRRKEGRPAGKPVWVLDLSPSGAFPAVQRDASMLNVLLQAAGLPLSDSYKERRRLLDACDGRYDACKEPGAMLKFHRRLIDSGLVDAK